MINFFPEVGVRTLVVIVTILVGALPDLLTMGMVFNMLDEPSCWVDITEPPADTSFTTEPVACCEKRYNG